VGRFAKTQKEIEMNSGLKLWLVLPTSWALSKKKKRGGCRRKVQAKTKSRKEDNRKGLLKIPAAKGGLRERGLKKAGKLRGRRADKEAL